VWSVQEAKARLSEVMRRARSGEPQVIGTRDPCVLVSAKQFTTGRPRKHLGRWLIEAAPRGAALELPPRASRRDDPFRES
jgi:prevent-host-death family protein